MKKRLLTPLAVFIIIAATIFATGIIYYNINIGRCEKVDQRWAQVDTVLQRRLDLVPNLVTAVKGYAKHEQETLAKVMEARSKLLQRLTASVGSGPKTIAQLLEIRLAISQMGTSLGNLFAIVENYPDLKASQNFLTLQDQLEGTENRIAIERQRYNDAVMRYNRGIRQFPGNLVAAVCNFEARPYFEAQPEAPKPLGTTF